MGSKLLEEIKGRTQEVMLQASAGVTSFYESLYETLTSD